MLGHVGENENSVEVLIDEFLKPNLTHSLKAFQGHEVSQDLLGEMQLTKFFSALRNIFVKIQICHIIYSEYSVRQSRTPYRSPEGSVLLPDSSLALPVDTR